MKASVEVVKEIENLYMAYEREILEKKTQGLLAENTVNTYLLHSSNFIKWIKDEFEPGSRNR